MLTIAKNVDRFIEAIGMRNMKKAVNHTEKPINTHFPPILVPFHNMAFTRTLTAQLQEIVIPTFPPFTCATFVPGTILTLYSKR